MEPEGIEGGRLSTISEVIWYLLSFNIAWRWLKQLDFYMLPPDVWVREEGGSTLSKDPFPSSSDQHQAAVEQNQSISVLWVNVLQLRKGALHFLLVTFTSWVLMSGSVSWWGVVQSKYSLNCVLFWIELSPAAGGKVPGSAKLVRKSLQTFLLKCNFCSVNFGAVIPL